MCLLSVFLFVYVPVSVLDGVLYPHLLLEMMSLCLCVCLCVCFFYVCVCTVLDGVCHPHLLLEMIDVCSSQTPSTNCQ